jgi:hypothetical protein
MATVLKIVAWAYGAIALLVLVVAGMGVRQDALAAAPAILVGLPWSTLLMNAVDSTSEVVNLALLVVAALVNFGVLYGLFLWLRRPKKGLN